MSPQEKEFPYQMRVATLGGGTGMFNVLRGIVGMNQPEFITAIPTTWDNGGSSGRLRTDLGVLPPGDARRCLIALMEDDEQREIALEVFNNRVEGLGKTLNGHSVGNLMISVLEKSHQGHDKGLDAARKLFGVRSMIAPVSLNQLILTATSQSGTEIVGEDAIDTRWSKPDFNPQDRINSIYFTNKPRANKAALEALQEADLIVLSMGSLFGSILPHLLVPGVTESIMKSRAQLVFILNIMTERGQTDDFIKASDHLKPLLRYLGESSRLNAMVVNDNHLKPTTLEDYRQEGQVPVEIDDEECLRLAPKLHIIRANLAGHTDNNHLLRHDPQKLAEVLLQLDKNL